jgi:hypothetical protein
VREDECELHNDCHIGGVVDLFERLHDVRMVRAPARSSSEAAHRRDSGELGHRIFMQEVITLSVFVPFAVLYMKQPIKLDFLWAGLCLMAAVYFIFRA